MHPKDDQEWRFAHFPEDVREAHRHSIFHREEVLASTVCGCFYCYAVFPPSEIEEWTDDDVTALCPKCGMDTVIGDKSGYEITTAFMEKMKRFWFYTSTGSPPPVRGWSDMTERRRGPLSFYLAILGLLATLVAALALVFGLSIVVNVTLGIVVVLLFVSWVIFLVTRDNPWAPIVARMSRSWKRAWPNRKRERERH